MSKDFFLCFFFIGEDRDESDDDSESLLESFRLLLLLSLDSNSKVFSWALRSCVLFSSSLSEESSFEEDDEELEDEEDLLFRPRVLVSWFRRFRVLVLDESLESRLLRGLRDSRFSSEESREALGGGCSTGSILTTTDFKPRWRWWSSSEDSESCLLLCLWNLEELRCSFSDDESLRRRRRRSCL